MSHKYSLNVGFGYTWQHDYPLTFPNTPNGPFDYDYRSWGAKATGQYFAPWGISISPVFRYQAGSNFARTLSVSAPASCACSFSAARGGSLSNTTVYATQYNANAQDNISVFDMRVEKSVKLGAAKLRLFLDGFNLANSYAGGDDRSSDRHDIPAADRDPRSSDRPDRRPLALVGKCSAALSGPRPTRG